MKKIISVTVVAALLLSIMTFGVLAATDATVYTEASQSEVSVGGSLTYYIYLSGTYDGYSLVFDTKQSGLTVDSVTGEAGVFADNLGDSWMVSVIGGLCKQESEKTKIATVTLTVDADAASGLKTFEFSDIAISNEIGDKATYTLESGSVTVASPVVEEPDEVEITSLKILDGSYDELDNIPDNDFTAEVTVSNNSKDGAFTVMLCSYDEDGVLLEVRYMYANPAAGTSISLGASIGNAVGEVAKIKAMVFDTLKSLAPITESVEITK